MEIIKTELDGVLLIQPDVYPDSRGFFLESYNKKRYEEAGVKEIFVQDNISKSVKGTIRGLHYQVGEFAQGKLCYVLFGKVLDVAVDVRFNSPTFGKYASIELTSEKKNQIWIPPGFAHGFAVLSDEAVFCYKCTALYSKPNERAILYNDPDIAIDWNIENQIVSEKDLQAKRFKEIEKDFIF
ncbi:MAG: dTDP-4-dehydrorhamnose 3,5-epimerase [Ignavibacteriales bacterium]|nr:dTDP-4-dehydrorhamnose 3,5-epimerase [Ignavibacteriales bacterium]